MWCFSLYGVVLQMLVILGDSLCMCVFLQRTSGDSVVILSVCGVLQDAGNLW